MIELTYTNIQVDIAWDRSAVMPEETQLRWAVTCKVKTPTHTYNNIEIFRCPVKASEREARLHSYNPPKG